VGGSLSYTWSRLWDNLFQASSYTSVGGKQNNYDIEAEYSVSGLDVPHRVVLSPVVALPFGEGKRWLTGGGFANRVLGGWQLAAMLTFESGQPIGFTQPDNTGLLGASQRPNWTGVDPNTPGGTLERLKHYVNPAASAPRHHIRLATRRGQTRESRARSRSTMTWS